MKGKNNFNENDKTHPDRQTAELRGKRRSRHVRFPAILSILSSAGDGFSLDVEAVDAKAECQIKIVSIIFLSVKILRP
jgi:hypothetical protein